MLITWIGILNIVISGCSGPSGPLAFSDTDQLRINEARKVESILIGALKITTETEKLKAVLSTADLSNFVIGEFRSEAVVLIEKVDKIRLSTDDRLYKKVIIIIPNQGLYFSKSS